MGGYSPTTEQIQTAPFISKLLLESSLCVDACVCVCVCVCTSISYKKRYHFSPVSLKYSGPTATTTNALAMCYDYETLVLLVVPSTSLFVHPILRMLSLLLLLQLQC